jgi:hypothetical protein
MSAGTLIDPQPAEDLSTIHIASGLIMFNTSNITAGYTAGYHLPTGTSSPQELILCNLIPETITIIADPNPAQSTDPSLNIVGPNPTGGATGVYYTSIAMTKQYDTIKLLYYSDLSGLTGTFNNWIIQSTSSGFTGVW